MNIKTIVKKFVQNIIKFHKRVRWIDEIIHNEIIYYIGKHNKLKPMKSLIYYEII